MEIPASMFEVLAFLVLVLPGVVYAAARTSLSGMRSHDRDLSVRVLQALLVSVVLDVMYLLILGRRALDLVRSDETVVQDPRRLALALLVLGLLIPAGLAFVVHADLMWTPIWDRKGFRWLRRPWRGTPHRSIPTAWDFAAPARGSCWVRIRLGDGKWVGGWVGGQSYVSTYPEPRDIFIEDQHEISDTGVIGAQIPDTAGVWVALPEGAVVEWIEPGSGGAPSAAPD